MTTTTSIIPTREHVAAFLSRVDPVRGRIILCIDATASREQIWDQAIHLQVQMFETVAAIGGLDVQLVYYRAQQCVASHWLSDPKELAAIMSRVTCDAGYTQIRKVLAHARKENAREKVNAVVVVSDACEETAHDLYGEARELGSVPVFMFQEGPSERVGEIYAKIARITGGAYSKFDDGAAQRLADLLKGVAAFAAGGIRALADQKTEAARLLLTQIKK